MTTTPEQVTTQRDRARQIAMDLEEELHSANQVITAFWAAHATGEDDPARPNLLAAAVEAYATHHAEYPGGA